VQQGSLTGVNPSPDSERIARPEKTSGKLGVIHLQPLELEERNAEERIAGRASEFKAVFFVVEVFLLRRETRQNESGSTIRIFAWNAWLQNSIISHRKNHASS
jgi:hypothetical protein